MCSSNWYHSCSTHSWRTRTLQKFFKDFASMASSLHLPTHKDQPFVWASSQQEAFKELIRRLITATALAHYYPNCDLVLETDESMKGLGGGLPQINCDGRKLVLVYASQMLIWNEKNYSTCKQDLLAVIWAVEKFHVYLGGSEKSKIVTDHNALVGLLIRAKHAERLVWWKIVSDLYCFFIHYRPGI